MGVRSLRKTNYFDLKHGEPVIFEWYVSAENQVQIRSQRQKLDQYGEFREIFSKKRFSTIFRVVQTRGALINKILGFDPTEQLLR